ncbi:TETRATRICOPEPTIDE-LIKE HELICAL [Salix purpurea]|uniref:TETRATRICOPEPTIDE-LIKE HELICAL n=1 Tax=Salix purpurea TaxID=77065 RepID=A0A9Q0W3Q7_SALPP|nr:TETRATRICOPEPTIDE-LIKE HELICAL [Salix purpurea]
MTPFHLSSHRTTQIQTSKKIKKTAFPIKEKTGLTNYYKNQKKKRKEKLNILVLIRIIRIPGRERKKTKKRRHSKNKKRDRSRDEDARDFGSRKSNVRVWAGSDTNTTKDYYFDTHGDRDNLVYGTPYRMDVPRYKPYNSKKLNFQGLYLLNKRGRGFDRDGDIDALDTQLKSGGRYWSSKVCCSGTT